MENYDTLCSSFDKRDVNNEELYRALDTAPDRYIRALADSGQDRQGLSRERPDFVLHAQRTRAIVERYAGEDVPEIVPHLAMIHDIVARAVESPQDTRGFLPFDEAAADRQELAAAILADIITEPSFDVQLDDMSRAHFLCVLGDTVELEAMAERYREQVVQDEQDSVLGRFFSPGSRPKDVTLEPSLWLVKSPKLDVDHLVETCESVNIEAIIIKAAEMLDNITHPPASDVALLQDVIEIETFHAPLCEVLGLDSLAMQLRSEAKQQRLLRAGYGYTIDMAKQLREPAVETGVSAILEATFGQKIDERYGTIDMQDDTKMIRITRPDSLNRLICRIKTTGSLADKLRRDARPPMDVVGMTAVYGDVNDLFDYFGAAISALERNPNVRFQSAPSKQRPIYIQGDARYIQSIRAHLGDSLQELVQPKQKDEGAYRVSKITFMVTCDGRELPVEMQFLAECDHRNGRLGTAAHILYKHDNKIDDSEKLRLAGLLERINIRMSKMDKKGMLVNQESQPSGANLLYKLSSVLADR